MGSRASSTSSWHPARASQALALAAAELERRAVRLHVRIDERGAGSSTSVSPSSRVGRCRSSRPGHGGREPASRGARGAPLRRAADRALADRPAELRGIPLDQTTMQPGIFAGAAGSNGDVVAPEGAPGEADAAGAPAPARPRRRPRAVNADGRPVPHPGPGTVHLNLQLREPLSAAIPADSPLLSAAAVAAADLPDVPAPTIGGRGQRRTR
ncbi:hypothetical protein ACFFRL_19610 [Agromyces hippuratus]|uniref:hypothetical protein n=1 Tax=Agromyces hippuratus TaxID=286438 RepID=UPI0035EB473D